MMMEVFNYFGREECKDGLDERRDEIYEKDLKNYLLVKELNALPSDMSNIITTMAFSRVIIQMILIS